MIVESAVKTSGKSVSHDGRLIAFSSDE